MKNSNQINRINDFIDKNLGLDKAEDGSVVMESESATQKGDTTPFGTNIKGCINSQIDGCLANHISCSNDGSSCSPSTNYEDCKNEVASTCGEVAANCQ